MAAASRGFESSSYFNPSLSNAASSVSRGNSASSLSRIPLYEDDALGHSPLRDEETPASPNSQWASDSTSALAHQREQVGSASTIRASSAVSTVPHTAYTNPLSPWGRGSPRHMRCKRGSRFYAPPRRSDVVILTKPQSGYNGLLDVARQTYKECTEDVHRYVTDLNNDNALYVELRKGA
ncbi:hypothetical protein HYQ45_018824 [Verticillium longisporum]|uniref:Uncharacterized protein n=1 Tax=Verticillium longisporum TaxID=100787 RepID=A0A8I3AVV8_VERLO|nr:hypothetical protein HYQ45_018824 [Verticillium longisporum]